MFLGDWECASGTREIDCGRGVVDADLALGPANMIRFVEGRDTRLLLLIPSRALVPGLAGGPTCELAFDAGADNVVLHGESICTDDQSESIVVRHGSARFALTTLGAIAMTTISMTSQSCAVTTRPLCYSIDD
jgi:hypothetical protein